MRTLRSTFPRSTLPLGLCAAILCALGWSAVPSARPQDAGAKPEGVLHESMEELKSTMRKLGRELQEKDLEGSLPFVSALQRCVLAGKDEVPQVAATVPEAERTAFVHGFRAMMVDLLRASCDLESALLKKDFDEAQRLFRDVLKPMEDKGHEKYRPD